ncbi:DUF3500 domain-containing protein [Brevibacterium sp. UCMA 11754]|uniref:DUF3500 domain-containing protein n=1 Tax=Brevibacterium sp. UCMA 11754 TaxID=2749198 RepID=UPI001F166A38|nr:DUF3500 domain-containing protein [Brevibacterium sp. UCMA 11754]
MTTAGWGHIHTIYGDPSNDYADSVEQQEGSGMGMPGGGEAPGDGAQLPDGARQSPQDGENPPADLASDVSGQGGDE